MFLKKFGLQDFKALSGKHIFDFRPISVLVGKNSSGKSSLTKAVLLLAESYSRNKNFEEINFSESSLLLGGYKTLLNNTSKQKNISFILPLNLDYTDGVSNLYLLYKSDNSSDGEKGILSEMRIEDPHGTIIFAGYYNIESFDQVSDILKFLLPLNKLIYKDEFIDDVKLDDTQCILYRNPAYFSNYLNDHLESGERIVVLPSNSGDSPLKLYTKEEMEEFAEQKGSDIFNSFNNYSKSRNDNDLLIYSDDPDLLKFYKGKFVGNGLFKSLKVDYTSELPPNQTSEFSRDQNIIFQSNISLENEFSEVINTIDYDLSVDSVCAKIENLFSYETIHAELSPKGQFIIEEMYNKNIKKAISASFDNLSKISYLSPYRGVTRRIYFNDGGGSQFSFLLDKFSLQKMSKKESTFVNAWLKTFDAGEKIFVERYHGAGISVIIEKDGKKILLADLGYGYHQIIPILIQIIINYRESQKGSLPGELKDSTMIVEEPESNLHPNLQSILADLFVDAALKFNIQFIIESHSEYLIRKLQYLTAKGKINSGDVNIHYFNDFKDRKGIRKNEVYEILIQKNGSLSRDFGPGFLDEADNLALQLLIMKKNQSN